MNETDQFLKVDVAGRVWTPRERREALLDEFARGGTPAAAFARLVGIKYPTFASWVQQRRRARGNRGQATFFGAPVKRASARVKVPSVQLDGSAPQTMPTASPRGGVGSRHGIEPAGRNEHMNHINEPRKSTPGSRAPQDWAKAVESEPRPTVVGSDNRPAGSAWTTCREVTPG